MLIHEAMAPAMIGKMIRHASWPDGQYMYYANGRWYVFSSNGVRQDAEGLLLIQLNGQWELYEHSLTVAELLNGDIVVKGGEEFEFIGATNDGRFVVYRNTYSTAYARESIKYFKRKGK